jgi:hypothetical protein
MFDLKGKHEHVFLSILNKYIVQQYIRYIVANSFIGGGNRNTGRKPLTCHKSLTNFIT